MRKIVMIKEPSILRAGLVRILESMSTDVKIIVNDAIDIETIMELEHKGAVIIIDVDAQLDYWRVINHFQTMRNKLVIWTANPTNPKLLGLFHRNLHGYFFERMDTGELVAAIRKVFRGERYIDPAFSGLLLAALAE